MKTINFYMIKKTLIFILVFLSLISVSYSTSLTQGVVYYSYDDFTISGSDLTDLTGYNNATFQNVNTGQTGVFGEAFEFYGNSSSYTSAPDSVSLDINGDLTIGGFYKFDDLPNGLFTILGAKWGGQESYQHTIYNNGGNHELRFFVSNDGTTNRFYSYNLGAGYFDLGRWYHIVAVFDSSAPQVTYYINGQAVITGSGSLTTTIFNSNADLTTGTDSDQTSFLNGFIDEFFLYNFTLNSSQITTLNVSGNPFGNPSSTPQIQTNLTSFVNQGTFTSSATTTSNVNMSLYLNGTLDSTICNNCNSSTFNLSLPLGFTAVQLRSENADGVNWNNITLEYDSNHYFRFYDIDNSSYVQNYTFGDVNSIGDYVTLNTSDLLPYGNFSKKFIGAGYLEQNFTGTLSGLSVQLNQTFNVSKAEINFFLKRVSNGSDAPNGNYTIILTNDNTGNVNTYSITNDNNLTIQNNYASNTNVSVSVIQNSSVTSSQEVILPRQNVNITLYLPFEEEEEQRVIEVLTGTLLPIANNDVYLYRFIEGEGFVLQTIKTTNVLGQVVFNIVPLSAIYNICSIYEGEEKCLNQVTFENAETDSFQIVHDINLDPITRNYLQDIEWSYTEVKTNTTSQITMSFDDSSTLTSAFCYNVTRTTNGTSTTSLGSYCNNNYIGQEVNTFGLLTNQFIDFTFYYVREGETFILESYRTYGENADLTLFNQASLFDVVFLILYFGALGYLLRMGDVNKYNIGVLTFLAFALSVQAYFNVNYAFAVIWSFIGLKTAVFYGVRINS